VLIRYAIVRPADPGYETLVFPNWSNHHYDTQEEAERALEAFKPDLKSRLGITDARVRKALCYDHGEVDQLYPPDVELEGPST
jgi:hypothetical protein